MKVLKHDPAPVVTPPPTFTIELTHDELVHLNDLIQLSSENDYEIKTSGSGYRYFPKDEAQVFFSKLGTELNTHDGGWGYSNTFLRKNA